MGYLRPLPYEILKLVHCFYNDYGKEPKTLALEPKRAKKEPKRANFLKFNYGLKQWYTTHIDKDKIIKKVHKNFSFCNYFMAFHDILIFFFFIYFFGLSPPS